jgi:hypothetical protein
MDEELESLIEISVDRVQSYPNHRGKTGSAAIEPTSIESFTANHLLQAGR